MVIRRLLLFGLLMALVWVASTPLPGRGHAAASSRQPDTEVLTLSQGVNGYSGATDAWMNSLQPTTNYGNQPQMALGGSGQADLLVRFDLTGMPPGIEIQSASLRLDVAERTGPDVLSVAAYRLRRSWSEDDVTWLLAANGTPWGEPGASDTAIDRFPVAIDVAMLDQIDISYRWDVTEVVQDWQALPAQNHGLILAAADSPAFYTLYSSESTDLDLRPKLVIEYVTQPATETPTATPLSTLSPPPSTSTPDLPTPTPTPTASSTPSPAATSTVTMTPTMAPSSLAVELALPAACDQGFEGDTRAWPAQVSTYTSCRSTWPETGPEAIYKLSLNEASDLSAQLVHDTTGVDLDLFLLTGSDPETCMAGEDASLVMSQLQPGDYYLVVDGYQGSAGPFHLQVTCGTRLGRISYLPIYIHSH